MELLQITIACVLIFIVWSCIVLKSLATQYENMNSSIVYIGIQLSSRWDVLVALLDLVKCHVGSEYDDLSAITIFREPITSKSTSNEIYAQEAIIESALLTISKLAAEYPQLHDNPTFKNAVYSINQYENSIKTCRLIYNESVRKINKRLRRFPAYLIGYIFKYRKCEYLESVTERLIIE